MKATDDAVTPKDALDSAAGLEVVKKLRPLTDFLHAPDNLIWLPKVAKNFAEILELVGEVGDATTRKQLRPLDQCIQWVTENKANIENLYPLANAVGKTLHGYKGTHPHYCLYEVLPTDPVFSLQWKSMVATLLPALSKVQRMRKLLPNDFSEVEKVFCRALRHLSKPNPRELLLLTDLSVQPTQLSQFKTRFEQLLERVEKDRSGNDFSTLENIHRVLEWIDSGSDEWRKGSQWGKSNRGNSREPRRTAALATDKVSFDVSPAFVTCDDGRRQQISRYFERPTKQLIKEEAFDKNQLWDQTPIGSTLKMQPEKVMNYFLQNRRPQANQNARYAAQAIEMANQRLPITNATLSGFEVSRLFQAFTNLDSIVWAGIAPHIRAKVAAWGACRYFLSRDATELTKFTVCRNGSTQLAPTLALAEKAVWLKAMPPKHQPPDQNAITITVQRAFELRLPPWVFKLLAQVAKDGTKLFGTAHEELFAKLLKNLNELHQTEISPYRVERAVAEQMSQLAPADWAISTYFLGKEPNSHNPAVYSAVPVSRLQALFDEACALVARKSEYPTGANAEQQLPGLARAEDLHVGSLHVPRLEVVQKAVSQLKTKINEFSRMPVFSLPDLHNVYTAYVCVFLLATTGVRAVSGLISANFDVDYATGICFVSDKDNEKYTNARLVWFCPEFIEQLRYYREHVIRMRQRLASENYQSLDKLDAALHIPELSSHRMPNRSADAQKLENAAPFLFFLNQGAMVQDVSPSLIAAHLGKDWELRIGSLRHYVRTGLLKAGCSGEIINALFGHGERGESPWGKFSTLPPVVWRTGVSEALESVFLQLSLLALRSPLLGTRR